MSTVDSESSVSLPPPIVDANSDAVFEGVRKNNSSEESIRLNSMQDLAEDIGLDAMINQLDTKLSLILKQNSEIADKVSDLFNPVEAAMDRVWHEDSGPQ